MKVTWTARTESILKPFPADNFWAELCLEAVSDAFLKIEIDNFHGVPQRALTPPTLKPLFPLRSRDLAQAFSQGGPASQILRTVPVYPDV